jgi:hypothetical protein
MFKLYIQALSELFNIELAEVDPKTLSYFKGLLGSKAGLLRHLGAALAFRCPWGTMGRCRCFGFLTVHAPLRESAHVPAAWKRPHRNWHG